MPLLVGSVDARDCQLWSANDSDNVSPTRLVGVKVERSSGNVEDDGGRQPGEDRSLVRVVRIQARLDDVVTVSKRRKPQNTPFLDMARTHGSGSAVSHAGQICGREKRAFAQSMQKMCALQTWPVHSGSV